MEICKIVFFVYTNILEFLKVNSFFHGLKKSVLFSNSYSNIICLRSSDVQARTFLILASSSPTPPFHFDRSCPEVGSTHSHV